MSERLNDCYWQKAELVTLSPEWVLKVMSQMLPADFLNKFKVIPRPVATIGLGRTAIAVGDTTIDLRDEYEVFAMNSYGIGLNCSLKQAYVTTIADRAGLEKSTTRITRAMGSLSRKINEAADTEVIYCRRTSAERGGGSLMRAVNFVPVEPYETPLDGLSEDERRSFGQQMRHLLEKGMYSNWQPKES